MLGRFFFILARCNSNVKNVHVRVLHKAPQFADTLLYGTRVPIHYRHKIDSCTIHNIINFQSNLNCAYWQFNGLQFHRLSYFSSVQQSTPRLNYLAEDTTVEQNQCDYLVSGSCTFLLLFFFIFIIYFFGIKSCIRCKLHPQRWKMWNGFMGEFPPLRRRLCLFCSLNCVIEFGVSPAGVWHGLWKRQMCSCVSASVIRRRRDCERPNILNAESWPARCRRQLAFRHCCHVCCAKWARNNAEPGLSIHNQRKERTETRRCEREIASRQPIFFTFFFFSSPRRFFPSWSFFLPFFLRRSLLALNREDDCTVHHVCESSLIYEFF